MSAVKYALKHVPVLVNLMQFCYFIIVHVFALLKITRVFFKVVRLKLYLQKTTSK